MKPTLNLSRFKLDLLRIWTIYIFVSAFVSIGLSFTSSLPARLSHQHAQDFAYCAAYALALLVSSNLAFGARFLN
jgi:hypothetical protein